MDGLSMLQGRYMTENVHDDVKYIYLTSGSQERSSQKDRYKLLWKQNIFEASLSIFAIVKDLCSCEGSSTLLFLEKNSRVLIRVLLFSHFINCHCHSRTYSFDCSQKIEHRSRSPLTWLASLQRITLHLRLPSLSESWRQSKSCIFRLLCLFSSYIIRFLVVEAFDCFPK